MVVDDSVTVVVPDSEGDGEGEETLIFSPYDDDDLIAPIEAGVVPLGQAARLEPDDVPSEHGKRFLRRRKAIQRMPYSLDRLKHKQFLQGYDVSGFESISEELRLPNRNSHPSENSQDAHIPSNSSRRRDNDSQIQYEDIEMETITRGSRFNAECEFSGIDNKLSQEEDEYEEEQEEEDEEEEEEEEEEKEKELVKFRGRLINIKTGFRGVLPRVAWEKAMKQQNTNKQNYKRRRDSASNYHRGVAKKKHVSVGKNVNQDDFLLDDLIVPDDEVTLDAQTAIPSGGTSEQALRELEQIDQQYQTKYDQEYLSDEEEADNNEMNDFIIELDEDHNKNEVEIAPTSILTPQDSFNQYDDTTDLIEIGAVENDEGGIDNMLSREPHSMKSRHRKPNNNRLGKTTQPGSNRKSSNYRVTQQKKSIRGQNRGKTRQSMLPSRYLPSEIGTKEHGHLSESKLMLSQKKQDCKFKNRKSNPTTIGPFAPMGSTNTRRANVFSTVIEAPSDKYAFPKHGASKTESLDMVPLETNNDDVRQEASLSVLDSLFNGKQVNLPDTVSIHLQDKQFVLSRFHRNDTASVLTKVFDHIIDRGVTDKELLQISETVTLFILYLNHLSVLPTITEFHKRFRSKVSLLREKAKSIHFYQIAVCQLMFLEISKYSDIANALQMEIKASILNHVVSFFKLLSYCFDAVVKSDVNYLFQSFDILSKITHMLEGHNILWGKLKDQRFRPEVCFFLVNTFPTDSPYWEILKIEQEHNSLSEAFKFVSHCRKRFNWSVNKDLIFLFDKIFKKRRYENFAAEDLKDTGRLSIDSTNSLTVFNNYLGLLQETELTDLVVERITPMGELATNDSLGALTNRLNLLIVLARGSNINLEKRMEDLIRSLLNSEYLSKESNQSLKRISQLILDCILSLAEINKTKNFLFKGRIIVTTFKYLVFEYAALLEGIWTNFLDLFLPIMEASNKSRLAFCKEFYFCLILMSQKDMFTKDLVRALQFYLRNLSLLGATWTQRNILQIVKNKVHLSANWIDYYCAVGKFLIQSNVMSWWSFYMYNDVRDSLTNKFYFDCKILQMCDNQSFELIKKFMFTTATNSILHLSSTWFLRFLIQLMNREYPTIIEYRYNKQTSDMIHVVKKFLWILNRLCYNDLLLQFISNLKNCFQQKTVAVGFVTEIVEYLNLRFIDQIKSSHDFFSLKRELGISDIEAEKSAFRDAFKSRKDLVSQACFLELGLILALPGEEEIKRYMDKLESLFNFSVPESSFYFFTKLISVHLHGNFIHYKRKLVTYFLYLINRVLNLRYLQISSTEFLELCMLHKTVCLSTSTSEASISPEELSIFRTECLQLQINVLKIADGFLEFESLAKMSKFFLNNRLSEAELLVSEAFDIELSNKIEEILRNNDVTTQPIDWHFPCESNEKELESKLCGLIMDVCPSISITLGSKPQTQSRELMPL